MSLDNVIGVAGAAKGSLLLLVFGLVVSIPLVVVGSQLIMKLIERFPWLVVAGGGLLGYIAGEMIVDGRRGRSLDRRACAVAALDRCRRRASLLVVAVGHVAAAPAAQAARLR